MRRRTQTGAFTRGLLVGAGLLVLVVAVVANWGLVHQAAQAVTPFSIEDVGGSIGLPSQDLKTVLINILKWTLGILALVAVAFIIYGGVIWMTAQGDQQKILKAKKIIASALIGLIIVLMSWAIVVFVVGTAANVTNSSSGGSIGPPPLPLPTTSFEIRSITTGCGAPPAYRDDVFLCSAVSITFNHQVVASSVKTAVSAAGNDELVIEKCDNTSTATVCNNPTDAAPAIMGQDYSATDTGTKPEWIVPASSKSIVFYHKHEFFEPNTFYRISIPKKIHDSAFNEIEYCRKNTIGTPIDGEGCNDQGDYFDWIFKTGVTVDNDPPDITTTYPDTRYRQNSAVYHPDRNVNRVPIITVQLDEAIDPNSIDQTNVAPGTWGNNTVVIEEYTVPPNANDGSLGTLDPTPLDPAKFTVVPNGDNTGLEIQLKPGTNAAQPNMLKEFTWYKVTVQHLKDLCQNLQAIDPYTIVFETNNVVPGVSSVYPANDYQFSCPDTDVSINYTVSMYDSLNSSCAAAPVVGGFITEGILKDEFGAPVGVRGFDVAPEFNYPGAPANPNDFCKVYAFRPTAASLDVNRRFDVGVNSRYMLTETDSLNFGDLANPPRAGLVSDPAAIDWHFNVKPPDQCANAPQILDVHPASGPVGQCFTIIGNYFGAGGNPADEAKMGPKKLGTIPPDGAWSDHNIVSTAPNDAVVPPGNSYPISVSVEHGPPFGVLTSTWGGTFQLTNAAASTGPCLFSLNPDSGPWGTLVDLAGIRFQPQNATSKVKFVGSPTGEMPFNGWSNTFINGALILNNSVNGLVHVQNSVGDSNPLLLTTFPPAPGQPRVTNVWPGCDSACVNADIGAKFDQNLDPTTVKFSGVAASVELWKCPDQNCAAPTVKLNITAGQPPPGPDDTVKLLAHDALTSDTWYRVVLFGGPAGIKGDTGGELFPGGLNFDTDIPTPGNDSYAWVFKTKNDPTECRLSSVDVWPPGPTTLRINWTLDMDALAYGSPDKCNPGGQLLNGHAYEWDWSSTDPANVDITHVPSPVSGLVESPSQLALAKAVTPGETIQAETVQTYGTFNDTAVVAVTPDPTFCNTSSQCHVNEIGQPCSSECVSNRCTPVINTVNSGLIPPESGHEADWVTVRGCWFGNYQAGVSKVMFSANEEGGVPNPAQCGDSWRNFEVIRVVPAAAVTGPMTLIRDDGSLDPTNGPTVPIVPTAPTTGDTAVPDFQKLPGPSTSPHLCRLDPNHGFGGSADTLYGDNFQAYVAGTDKAIYTLNQDATIGTWANQQIDVNVPAIVADGDVVVEKGAETSNPVWYDVDGSSGGPPGGCKFKCFNDPDCWVGGCGSNGCCAPKPVISTNQPQGVNVCRNTVISATFTGAPINPSTVNNVSVKLLKAGVPVPVTYQADDNGFWLYPAVLAPNTLYDVEVNALVKSQAGVAAVPLTWSFTTGNEVCQLDRLTIDPAQHTFTQRIAPGNTQSFTAHAFAQNGMEISPVPGVYDWTWSWALVQAGPVTISSSGTNTETATAQQDGQTLLQVTATSGVGWSGTRSAVADIRVMMCDNLWSLADLATGTYHDTQNYGCGGGGGVTTFLGGACHDYNFSTTYCLGQNGGPQLPDLDVGLVRGESAPNPRLKEFIFKSSSGEARDAIGMLIFRNSEGLSPQAWLEQNQPGESTGGQSTTIQGYPAYRLGTTTYVASTNLNSTAESCTVVPLDDPSFENVVNCAAPGWECNAQPSQEPAAPNSLNFSAMLDASTSATMKYLVQNVETATTDPRTYRVEGWVNVRKINPTATGGAGLITQCANPDGSPNWVDCAEGISTSYDLYGGAPGASGNLGTNSGWRHIGPFTVSNLTGKNLMLKINCFAQPGWQVWCDNIIVKKVDNTCTGGTLDQNIYLLSYTEGASGETLAIVDQILRNWELNINPVLTAQDRVAIARDTQRLGDITSIKKVINGYLARGGVLPALEGGTFTAHLSTSKWSSWNATLGNAIGTGLPVDPLNNFDPVCSPVGPYQPEAETCWSQQNHQFICPPNSHVYGYLYTPGTCTGAGAPITCRTSGECTGGNTCTNPAPSYTVGTNLEYAGPANLRGALTDLCTDAATDPSDCRCFTKTVNGP